MKRLCWLLAMGTLLPLAACNEHASMDRDTLHFIIESSPNNLDVRQGTDAQSERVGELIYDPLVRKDDHSNLQPWLATSWERPDLLTWVFHLRGGVRFHDGKPLTADDVAWSIRSMTNGALITAKGGAFANVAGVDVRDPLTVVVHTREPVPSLLFNLSDGLFGVVEKGAGSDEGLHPVGTGPYKFVSQVQDKEVVIERNPEYWAGAPKIARVRFEIIPDTITTALEMKKGSGDVESNVITPDMVHALQGLPNLHTESGPSAWVIYANFNVTDPALRDPRVRQAIACAIDKDALIAALWRGQARPAETLLPPAHWAAASDAALPQYPHDIARALRLLDEAGLKPDKNGIRLRFTLKTSTDETTRLEAQAMQEEMRAAGIELSLRSSEFATFYSDITKGSFQMYILRWIGSNEDPDIFRYTSASSMFPPKGGNRGHYANARVDALLQAANASTDQDVRRRAYIEVQQILANDLPAIPLWYPNNEIVHSTRLTNVTLNPGGSFDFLRTAELR
ncbi:ABC transporter substrate-binding protein [Granulicella sp. S156]|jgi:peptide/nickel transport system substrate-binding protein|uniref:ABC transporter substrate-binding protein n=1 Tax=Granulicella sp. S156 TaxID=1747224 RepID=UPI00131E79DB|nr:ABC transporter substrate-binding protein [Granulicella sp. S156]